MFLDVLVYNRTKIYENVQVLLLKRTLSSLIIPVNVTNLKFNLLNVHIAICA